jgi:hypothetical protein
VFPLNRLDFVRQLQGDHVDLVVGWFSELPEGIRRSTLYQGQEAIVVKGAYSP